MSEARARVPSSAYFILAAASLALVPAAALQAQTAAAPAPWLKAESAARQATVALEVTAPAGAPSALLNGFREGAVQIVVPLGWTVTWEWRNADSTGKHSLAVMPERERVPAEPGQPAFSNALTRNVKAGLPAGQTDRTTFQADQAGWFWLLCGVPGHALAGEWIGLRVNPEATTVGALTVDR